MAYTWPAAAPGTPNNVVAAGQRIAVGMSGPTMYILGAANNGNGSGAGTITYTDGTNAPFTLALTNWTPGGPVLPADELVATAPYWNRPANSGYPADVAVRVYSTAIPPIVSKTVEYVTLPATTSGDQSGTRLHVFDLRVADQPTGSGELGDLAMLGGHVAVGVVGEFSRPMLVPLGAVAQSSAAARWTARQSSGPV